MGGFFCSGFKLNGSIVFLVESNLEPRRIMVRKSAFDSSFPRLLFMN